MKILVLHDNTQIELSIDPTSSISNLKQILSTYTGLDPFQISLSLNLSNKTQILNDSSPINQYNTNSNLIVLTQCSSESQQIDLNSCVSKLIEACQEANIQSFYDALQDYEKRKKVSLAVDDLKAILNTPYNGKWSCIHYASYMGHQEILKELLELSADCNMITNDHWTPLQISCYQGHLGCVKVLISHPLCNIDKMTSERGTGLHLASTCGHTEIVRILLENHANPALEDPTGRTALELSSTSEISELIPKYIGQDLLEKYSKNYEAVERPLSFSGEVSFTAAWLNSDKQVYIALDTQLGNFNHYKSRLAYIDEEPPDYSIPFSKISEVKIHSEPIVEKHFFLITGNDVKLKYYTSFLDMTEEWTKRILDAIGFFRTFIPPAKSVAVKLPESYEEATFQLDHFEITEEVGTGSFGQVFKVKKTDSDDILALRCLNKTILKQRKKLKKAIASCKMLKSVRHPFILPLYGAFQSDSHLFMILEFCPLGDFSKLLSYLHHLTVAQAKFYISEVILAVEHLHSLDLVYRDLSPQNILLDSFGHLRLADFSLGQKEKQKSLSLSFSKSFSYSPPELLTESKVAKPADIYSIGANLFEMLSGDLPFSNQNTNALFHRIINESLKFPESFHPDARSLVEGTMRKNPEDRLTIPEIKSHIFFKDVDWENMSKKKVQPPFSSGFLMNIKSSEKIGGSMFDVKT